MNNLFNKIDIDGNTLLAVILKQVQDDGEVK